MDVTTVSDDSTEPSGIGNSGYAGSPDLAGFDRWDSDSPDVKTNDVNAFAASMDHNTAAANAYQSQAGDWLAGTVSGDLGDRQSYDHMQ